eukprot:GEMP01099624.1.p1 GENE.GEMP01099624.1~~GEMP01099624.1.p1  ORF type:complete len:212 (+),score=51.10 GEMP01099624.1:154-789(+)
MAEDPQVVDAEKIIQRAVPSVADNVPVKYTTARALYVLKTADDSISEDLEEIEKILREKRRAEKQQPRPLIRRVERKPATPPCGVEEPPIPEFSFVAKHRPRDFYGGIANLKMFRIPGPKVTQTALRFPRHPRVPALCPKTSTRQRTKFAEVFLNVEKAAARKMEVKELSGVGDRRGRSKCTVQEMPATGLLSTGPPPIPPPLRKNSVDEE